MRFTCIGHGAKCWKEETLDEIKERKMMRWRKRLMTELGFFTLAKHALFIKYIMGLYKGTVQKYMYGLLYSAQCRR
jgi:hypothetical protein